MTNKNEHKDKILVIGKTIKNTLLFI